MLAAFYGPTAPELELGEETPVNHEELPLVERSCSISLCKSAKTGQVFERVWFSLILLILPSS